MLKNAKFNEDRTHRFFLSRLWDNAHSKILFIGINPSTADETEDDHTVTRLIKFSQSWGFGGFTIVNLYSFITPEPDDMKKFYMGLSKHQLNLHNKENLNEILRRARICSMVVFCWGANADLDDIMAYKLVRTFKDAYCFGHTKDGHPKHPLFLASHTQLIKFR